MTLAFSNLGAQRQFAGKLVIGLIWLMAPLVVGARLLAHGPVLGVLLAATAVAAGGSLAYALVGKGSLGRSLTGIALMAQVSMLVAAMSGQAWQIDMHMAYFAALAVLVVYCDELVIAAAATTVAIHHLSLSFLLPAAVFPGSADIWRVLIHAVILIVEAVALIGVTVSVNAMFASSDEARRNAEAAVEDAHRAHAVAEAARRSEETGRISFSETQAKAERQRADAVAAVANALSRLAAGDLTARIDAPFDSDYAQIKKDFNAAVESLRATMAAINGATGGIRIGSDEIAKASNDLSRRTETQAASLEQTAAALDEVTATVKQGAAGAMEASKVVSSARIDAQQAGGVVRDAVAAMGEIERSSAEITQIIVVIDEIAFQTNLLALNAGVEAARAGESGRGFAVVAQEVRALAQRSADAAKRINTLIAASTEQVGRGVELVGHTGVALDEIVGKVAEIDKIVAAIAQSSQEQATGLGMINEAINRMDNFTQQNAAMVEQSTAASTKLRAEAAELAGRVAQFTLGDGAGPTRRAA